MIDHNIPLIKDNKLNHIFNANNRVLKVVYNIDLKTMKKLSALTVNFEELLRNLLLPLFPKTLQDLSPQELVVYSLICNNVSHKPSGFDQMNPLDLNEAQIKSIIISVLLKYQKIINEDLNHAIASVQEPKLKRKL